MRVMVGWYLKRTDPVLARVWKVSTEKSVHEFHNWEVKKDEWVREFHEEARALGFSCNIRNGLTGILDRSGTLTGSTPSLAQDWLHPP